MQTKKLEELKREGTRLESELKKILSSTKDLSGELARIERQIMGTERDIAQSRERILALEKQRKALENEIGKLSQGILKEKSNQEAIAWVVQRESTTFLGDLLAGIPPSERESVVSLAVRCLGEKHQRIEEALVRQGDLARKLEELKQRIRLEVVLKEKLVLENKRLAELKKARGEILRRLEGEKARLERNRQELLQAQRNLEGTIAKLREELAKRRALVRPPQVPVKRGKLFWPVQGGTIFRPFGERKDARYGITFYNPGIDIACPRGTPVYAAADGVVILASTIRGYGKTIVIDHGNDLVTVYAHLGEIRVRAGDEVQGGQVIALSGDSGLVERPVVHFEVRVGTSAREEDPLLWLQ
ncbi:MAG: peptidoglycan DD-metalloendopeptidase family protein [Candidatus Caldatribacterium sp.]|uniref:murein hydrolase activator EnvC family protein n=1 Tax=Candidatus Caldatribacterium sp. TaxID=2282143 RepID=UPI0037EE6CEA|nr:peptidoglycan DD-metalloendopeptidase family protein [Candidatus Caldatribacterium sp.]MCX7730175.1 peptidoglycan DD-metalloendopeptidase family protein [Candidatus Caldatribacterium sp.]